jgi:hypothetical protein
MIKLSQLILLMIFRLAMFLNGKTLELIGLFIYRNLLNWLILELTSENVVMKPSGLTKRAIEKRPIWL